MTLLSILSNKGKMDFWNPSQHNDVENIRWTWHRSIEWINWPIFLSPTLLPVLLLIWPWQLAMFAVLLANRLWHLFEGRQGNYVSLQLSNVGQYIITIKWIVCPLMAAYFLYHGQIECASLTAAWPFFPLLIHIPGINRLLLLVAPQIPIRPVQEKLLVALGYKADFLSRIKL
jgi:hypothetical protein